MFLLPLKKALVFFFITLGIPAYLLMLSVLYIWYRLIVLVSKLFKSVEYPVEGVGTFLTPDKIHSRPNATLVHLAVLQGIPHPGVLVRDLQALYDLRAPDGSRKYDKLGFTIFKWMGYVFWKKVANFQIKEHIHFAYNQNIDHESISTFVEDIIRKPFKKDEPIWEIFVLCNAPKETPTGQSNSCSYVVIRCHHLLLDGMTLLKLWFKADGVDKLPSDLIKYSTCSGGVREILPFWDRVVQAMKIVIATPYLSNRVLCTPNDRNCLTKTYTKYNGEWFCSGVNKVEIRKYRQSLRDLEFSLTHALLVAYTRGLRKFLEMNYKHKEIPDYVHILGSIPLSNHPDETLTNHWTIMRYKTGIKADTLLNELQRAKNGYTRAVKCLIPDSFALMSEVGRWLPGKLYEWGMETRNSGTLALSNVPGPKTQQKMFDLPVTDRVIWLPLTRNNSGIALLFLTYNGYGSIAMTADSGCIKDRKLFDQLNNYVVDEFRTILTEVYKMASSLNSKEIVENLKEIKII